MLSTKGIKIAGWAMVAIGLAGGVVGQAAGWFRTSEWYDKALHAFTACALVLAIGSLIYPTIEKGHAIVRIGLLASIAVTLGALWEVAEWLVGTYWSPIIRSDDDTMLDLIADTVGALGGAVILDKMYPAAVAARPRRRDKRERARRLEQQPSA